MPNRTQYIRNEDVEKWDALPNRSAWIHEHLRHDEQKRDDKQAAKNEAIRKDQAAADIFSEPLFRDKKQGKL